MIRLALLLFSLAGALCVGGLGLAMASVATSLASVGELIVTCLTCGEEWKHLPAATLAQGCAAVLTGRRRLRNECPKCHSHEVVFGHPHHSRVSSTS